MTERKSSSMVVFVLGMVAILVSLAMIVMGLLHAAPIDSERGVDGVVMQNCTIIEHCGCPGEPMIPWYLIVGGCLTIIVVLGRLVWQMVRQLIMVLILGNLYVMLRHAGSATQTERRGAG